MGLCMSKGSQITSWQSWRFEKKFCHLAGVMTLQPLDLHRLTVHLWKDLELIINIISAQETGSILKIGFALSI